MTPVKTAAPRKAASRKKASPKKAASKKGVSKKQLIHVGMDTNELAARRKQEKQFLIVSLKNNFGGGIYRSVQRVQNASRPVWQSQAFSVAVC
ncbi:hypothetical protein [Gemmatimonas sp.]|uniref:hypothetical protein n=1 Tax=Gemmatimonas sp. TaxID=1962908 RepID=UPI003564A759